MEVTEITLPIPPSDNRRVIPVFIGGKNRLIKSPSVREYAKLAVPLLYRQWGHNQIIVPSVHHQLHISVKVYVPNWRSDVSNYTKTLKDLMQKIVYDNDKWVHFDYLDTEKDEANPRVVMLIPLDAFSIAATENVLEEELDDSRCTCTRQKLLELGWHYWETTHNPNCPRYKPLIKKHANRTRRLASNTAVDVGEHV